MKSLVTTFAVLLGLSGISSISSASINSADPIRCASMERLAQDHKTWSVGFEKFQTDFSHMNNEQQFFKATRGTQRILQNIEKFSEVAHVDVNQDLLQESQLDLDSAALGDIPKDKASSALKEKMIRLQTELSNAIFKAQAKTPDCNLGTVNSPTI